MLEVKPTGQQGCIATCSVAERQQSRRWHQFTSMRTTTTTTAAAADVFQV